MTNVRFGWFAFCALVVTSGCRTPSPSWNGTWKLNPSKSSFSGTIITISISPDGEYRYDDGTVSKTSRCDGQYRPIGNNRLQACVKNSTTTLDMTRMENGVKTNTYHWELSADGKVFTATATALRPSGPVVTGQLVALRISGSKGFAGQWRDVSFLKSHPDLTLSVDRQYLHIDYPSAGQYVDAPLNGADAAMYGPHAVAGTTYGIQRAGEREFLILSKRNGKILSQQSLTLSNDGRVVTYSWWDPNRPANKTTLVYERN
jgi:hypothetical protein